ncbi:MAG: site-2 protease family protein [Candidatus Aenigmatarchaeota archaeon]
MLAFEDVYTISVVLFFGLLALLIWRDRKHIEFHTLVIMRRTKRFRDTIDRLAMASPRFWKAFGTLGVIAALVAMVYGTQMLLSTANLILSGMVEKPAMQVILPSPGATTVAGPGYVLLPFWIWFFIIAMILIPHEMMHGVIARAEKIRLKSVGLLLLIIFPGAFVEPDERQLKRAKLMTRLRVFAAGSFANFFLAGLMLVITAYAFWPLAAVPSITLNITTVNASSPMAIAGVPVGTVVTGINGHPITPGYWEFVGGGTYLNDELGSLEVGQPVTFTTAEKAYIIAPVANPTTGKPWMGFTGSFSDVVLSETPNLLISFFTLFWILSSAVGLVNILPLKPLDGGLMFEAVAKKYYPKRSALLTKAMAVLLLALIVFAFVGPGIISAL